MPGGDLNLPPGHPPVDGSSIPSPLLPDLLSPSPRRARCRRWRTPTESSEATPAPEPQQPAIELPKDPFELLPPPAPLPPKAEPSKSSAPGGELPGDVFTPSPQKLNRTED